MALLEFDDEATKGLLAVYVTPDVQEQRSKFLNELNLNPGERVLDVGSGPGFLAQAMSEKVGPTGSVCGVDVSEAMLSIASQGIEDQAGIKFQFGNACSLPYPDNDFDVLVCTQVLEYVTDVDLALTEFHRVLRVGGKVALLDTDWDSIVWHSSDRSRMNRILTAWEEHAADPFLPRTLAEKLRRNGFQVSKQKVVTLSNPQFEPETYSNRIIDLIAKFVTDRGTIKREEGSQWIEDLRTINPYFFSLNRYLFLAQK